MSIFAKKAPTPETHHHTPASSTSPAAEAAVSRAAKRISTQPATLRQFTEGQTRQLPTPPSQPNTPARSPTLATTYPALSLRSSHDVPARAETLPLPFESTSRRRSFDDGVRPLNVLLNSKELRSTDRPNSAGTAVPREYENNRPGLHVDAANTMGGDIHLSPVNVALSDMHQDLPELPRASSHFRKEATQSQADKTTSPLSPQAPSITSRPLPDPFSRRQSSENGRQQALNGLSNASGRNSPIPHRTGSFSQRSSTLSEHTRAGTPMRDLPSLPQEVVSDGREDEITDDEQPQDDTITIPLALPPISFSDSDSFGDLLNLSPSNLSNVISVAPPPYTPKSDLKRSSSSSYTQATQHSPVGHGIQIDANATPPVNPRRDESFRRGTLNRKAAPEAIILPDTLDSDLTYDLDDYITPASPETNKSLNDSTRVGQNPSKSRPGSTGQISAGISPIPARSRIRSASVNTASPSTSDVATGSRSVSSPNPTVTVTQSTSDTQQPTPVKAESLHLVSKRIRQALDAAIGGGETVMKFDREFVEILDMTLQSSREKLQEMEGHFDGIRVSWFFFPKKAKV